VIPDHRLHVVLLAGGSGTRFWPLSRVKRPKQFLPFSGNRSLLGATWDRARKLVPVDRLWVVAPRPLAAAIRRELPALRRGRLVVEPSPRDTAPAIALACAVIARHDPEATTVILPTDHVIADADAFERAVAAACRAARDGALVCLGVRPHRPATGFGYLRVGARPGRGAATPVMEFVEKPDAKRALKFFRSGRYLWNGGMFVWRVGPFREELGRVAPRIRRATDAVAAGSPRAWAGAPKISLDYAVMEKAPRVVVVPLDAGWDDVGSWDAAARHASLSTAGRGGSVTLGSDGALVFGGKRLVAILDLPDIVVVDTPDALLVVPRASSERMKSLVEAVRASGRADLL
jgi:mannose-1-phosphate guanylyltransferase/mannose-6-phosphate isomerase